MPEISRRAASLGTENAFVVLAEVNALARQGKDIVSFCIGQPDFPAPDNVQEAAIRAIKAGKHGYTPSAGIDELRHCVSEYLARMRGGLPIRPEDVVVGAGAKPFIAYAILSTTDHGAGDEVIYPNPGFPIYESQIAANGAKPVPIHLHESRGFSFDPQELARLITPRTRLLILNYPHNPTGAVLSANTAHRLLGLMREKEDRLKEAVEHYRLAAQEVPDRDMMRTHHVCALARLGRYREALHALEQSAKLVTEPQPGADSLAFVLAILTQSVSRLAL